MATARDSAIEALRIQHGEAEQGKHALIQQRAQLAQDCESTLAHLQTLGDGEIIGDGRADFTRQTQRYDLELNGQPFALLDVPGIEVTKGWWSARSRKPCKPPTPCCMSPTRRRRHKPVTRSANERQQRFQAWRVEAQTIEAQFKALN